MLQVLPWLFYHKALGVETYFLFVEGKAALPNSTAVLESIPGVKLVPRTKELEDQQAKRWASPDVAARFSFRTFVQVKIRV